METRQFELKNIEVRSEKDMTCTAVLSSEYPVPRAGGMEVLDHSETAVDLSRSPLPLIVQHDHNALPVGIVEKLKIGL